VGGAWGDFTNTAKVAPGSGAAVIPGVDAAAINAAATGSSVPSGFTGGVEGGYNLVGNGILLGLETDWSAMDLKKGSTRTVNSALLITPSLTYTLDSHVHTDWTWTLRPRLGITGGSWLFYGTAGLAITDVKSDLTYSDTHNPARTASFSASGARTGWIAGLGGGYALGQSWSLKGEWLYADFGKIQGQATSSDGFVAIASEASVKSNTFRAGLDYRF
jgi:outer membrane immunogenic protein